MAYRLHHSPVPVYSSQTAGLHLRTFGMAGRFWARSGNCLGHQPPLSFSPPQPLVAEVQHLSGHPGAGRQQHHGGGRPEPGGDATRELLSPGAGTVPALQVPTPIPGVPEPLETSRGPARTQASFRLSAMCLGAPSLTSQRRVTPQRLARGDCRKP